MQSELATGDRTMLLPFPLQCPALRALGQILQPNATSLGTLLFLGWVGESVVLSVVSGAHLPTDAQRSAGKASCAPNSMNLRREGAPQPVRQWVVMVVLSRARPKPPPTCCSAHP